MSALALRRLRRVASLLLIAGLAVALWPLGLGGRASVVIVSGVSMEPGLHTGDLVVLREQPRYAPGEVVAFRVPRGRQGAGATVIHRVVAGDQAGYTLQGDNKERPDPWRPAAGDVIGARVLLIPRVGTVVSWLQPPIRLAALAAAITVFLVVGGLTRPAPAGSPGRPPAPGR